MDFEQIKQYLNKSNKLSFDIDIKSQLKELKAKSIELNQEDIANEIWCLETICKVQSLFISAFDSIKNGQHFDAWHSYDLIDIELGFLRKHFDYSNNKYNLKIIF